MVAVHDDEFAQQAILHRGEIGVVDDGRRAPFGFFDEILEPRWLRCVLGQFVVLTNLCAVVHVWCVVCAHTLMQFKHTQNEIDVRGGCCCCCY